MKIADLFPISEARRNPHLNISLSPYETLLQYQGKPNMFVSFTELDKLGINPRTTYSTPVGVYSYPLEYVLSRAKERGGDIFTSVPFAATAKYINVFQANRGNIVKMSSYHNADNDMRKLKNWHDGLKYKPKAFDEYVNQVKRYNNQAELIWKLVYVIVKDYAPSGRKTAIKTNMIFHKVLGWDGAIDDKNQGIIHEYEPTQAVFFSTRPIKVMDRIANGRGISGADIEERALQSQQRQVHVRFIVPLSGDFKRGAADMDKSTIDMAEDFFTNINARQSKDHTIKSTYSQLEYLVREYGLKTTSLFDRVRFINTNAPKDNAIQQKLNQIDMKIHSLFYEMRRRQKSIGEAKDLLKRVHKLLENAGRLLSNDKGELDGATLSIFNVVTSYAESTENQIRFEENRYVSLTVEPSVPTNRQAIQASLRMVNNILKLQ